MSALSLEGVTHDYGQTRAVDGLSLEVAAGEVVCLLGPSGCGKTTVLRLAAGLEPLQRGIIRLAGRVVAGDGVFLPPEARGVGLVFQDYALFPHLTVAENVAFGIKARNGERREQARAALERVGLADLAEVYPHTLSGGQQQRVALARALAPSPAVVLLDEPFSGLDARLRDRIRDETLHVLKGSGAAALMVTHDSEEAMFMADRIAVMEEGRIVQTGRPAELYCRPATAFVASFFSEVNRLHGFVAGGVVPTPLGDVEARGLSDGTPVEVLIRPEAVRLTVVDKAAARAPRNGAHTGRVLASRMLGRTTMIHVSVHCHCGLCAAGEDELHLHARMPGLFLPEEDRQVDISLDPAQTFVFPAAEAAH